MTLFGFISWQDMTVNTPDGPIQIPSVRETGKLGRPQLFVSTLPTNKLIADKLSNRENLQSINLHNRIPSEDLPVRLNGWSYDGQRPPTLLPENPAVTKRVVNRMRRRNDGTLRVALLDCFGSGLGDNLVGAHAFRYVRDLLSELAPALTIDALVTFGTTKPQRVLGSLSWIDRVRYVPLNVTNFMAYDAYFDFSQMLSIPEAQKTPWPDLQLQILGIDSTRIPVAFKRLRWDVRPDWWRRGRQQIAPVRSAQAQTPVVFVHSKTSSQLRDMPAFAIQGILRAIAARGAALVSDDAAVLELAKKSDMPNVRAVDAPGPEEFVAMLSAVDAVVTTNTFALHVAACAKTPTVGIFTAVAPDLFVKYQRNIIAIHIDPEGKLGGSWVLNDSQRDSETFQETYRTLWHNHLAKICDRIRALLAPRDTAGHR